MNRESSAPAIDYAEQMARTMIESKVIIIAVMLSITILGGLYCLLATPVYQSDVLIQVEQQQQSGPLADLASMMTGETPTDAEIEIIRSRSVIGKVVDDMTLDVEIEPVLFPLIGAIWARFHTGEQLAEPIFGASSYAWGGESLRLSYFKTPKHDLGEAVQLLVGEKGKYQLFAADDHLIVTGEIGQAVSHQGFELLVESIRARPGTSFNVTRQPWLKAVREVKEALIVQEKGKETGIIQLLFKYENIDESVQIINAIATAYLQQNIARRSEEAQQSLGFIESQMPIIKGQLTVAESAMNQFRLQQGSVDLGRETEALLAQVVNIEQQISALEIERDAMSKRFTEQHPVFQALNAQLRRLFGKKKKLQRKVKQLPATEQQLLQLHQDVKVNRTLYEFMLNKAQELRVAKAGTIGDVRILDMAVQPDKAVWPNNLHIISASIFVGLFLGIALVMFRKMMRSGIENPEDIEMHCALSVLASLPHSKEQVKLHKQYSDGDCTAPQLLALSNPTDMAIESLRSLRTSLHFSMMNANNNIVMLSGSAPDVGKSFVSLNLAQVLGISGQNILLIDADMRKGHLHQAAAVNQQPGLSEFLRGDSNLNEVIQQPEGCVFSLITTGTLPPNPAELLMHVRFSELLTRVSQSYDMVLLDTPPVLAATDASIIGKHADTSLLLIRHGRHSRQEIQQTVKQLKNAGVGLTGAIFNDLPPQQGYGSYGYRYQYTYD
ncbi:MAG: polysaccharide biosynthesis tyrosine autokinase [Mariprofundaceae bacterium]|nr:polysaccharide biosynthesis tyrosine autokinase [Mariprofundaceae bacterium]